MLRDILHTELLVTVDTSKGRSTTLVHMLARVHVAEESVTLCTDEVHELPLASVHRFGVRPHKGVSRECGLSAGFTLYPFEVDPSKGGVFWWMGMVLLMNQRFIFNWAWNVFRFHLLLTQTLLHRYHSDHLHHDESPLNNR